VTTDVYSIVHNPDEGVPQMSKTRIVSASIALIAACLLAPGAALADKGKNPATYTCAELIEVDVEYVPQTVYWLDGFNWAGDPVYDADVEWTPVEVDTIIIECKKDPSQKASEVVKKHGGSKK
jgi:hypothetical protein